MWVFIKITIMLIPFNFSKLYWTNTKEKMCTPNAKNHIVTNILYCQTNDSKQFKRIMKLTIYMTGTKIKLR